MKYDRKRGTSRRADVMGYTEAGKSGKWQKRSLMASMQKTIMYPRFWDLPRRKTLPSDVSRLPGRIFFPDHRSKQAAQTGDFSPGQIPKTRIHYGLLHRCHQGPFLPFPISPPPYIPSHRPFWMSPLFRRVLHTFDDRLAKGWLEDFLSRPPNGSIDKTLFVPSVRVFTILRTR